MRGTAGKTPRYDAAGKRNVPDTRGGLDGAVTGAGGDGAQMKAGENESVEGSATDPPGSGLARRSEVGAGLARATPAERA